MLWKFNAEFLRVLRFREGVHQKVRKMFHNDFLDAKKFVGMAENEPKQSPNRKPENLSILRMTCEMY